MNIENKPVSQVGPVNRLHPQTESKTHTQQKPVAATAEHTGQVSANSKAMAEAFQSLSSADDVDLNKVAQLKSAIARGELKLDSDAVINAILELHKA